MGYYPIVIERKQTRKMCSHIDLHTHNGNTFDNPVTLTSDFRVNAFQVPALHQMPSDFGVDSLSCFPLKHGHTHRPTQTKSAMPVITTSPVWVTNELNESYKCTCQSLVGSSPSRLLSSLSLMNRLHCRP